MNSPARQALAALAVMIIVAAFVILGDDDRSVVANRPTSSIPTPSANRAPRVTTSRPSARSSTTTTQSTSTSGPRNTDAGAEPVTLAFGGDIHFESFLRASLDANPDGMLAPIAAVLSAADIAVVNLETAITDGGTPAAKQYTFRAPATALRALAGAGVDVASMANNHGMDYGVDGLNDSLEAGAASSVRIVGIGQDATEAYAPATFTVRGQRIAVIGATQVLDDPLISAWTALPGKPGLASAKRVDDLVAAVRAARESNDTVVVFLHWGVEKQTCPSADQQSLAQTLVDAGADIVVGGHAHRLQGAGRLDGALVAYGLGNFVFYTTSGEGTETGVLTVTMRGRLVDRYDWTPAVLRNGIATPLSGDGSAIARTVWSNLRGCTNLDG